MTSVELYGPGLIVSIGSSTRSSGDLKLEPAAEPSPAD